MSSDWNRRARSDALYYVALGQRDQPLQAFLEGAADVIGGLERELRRLPSPTAGEPRSALEIGCGPGRLMLPMSRHFSEIHGVDVSSEMVRLARRNLAGISHAQVHTVDGTSLTQFAESSFDFVYSFAVFQHIPSREVVFQYLQETRRVLHPGGVARMQFNGLAEGVRKHDTWQGVRFTAGEIARFAFEHDLLLLALEGAGSQYLWATFARPAEASPAPSPSGAVSIRHVTDAGGSVPVVPARGRHAAFALWVEGLPPGADLNRLRVEIAGRPARLTFLGVQEKDGLRQLTGYLPPDLGTGFQRVNLFLEDATVPGESYVRLIPPGPEPPQVISVSDSVFVGAGRTIHSKMVRIYLEGAPRPDDLRVSAGGRPMRPAGVTCTVRDFPRFEIDFKLPSGCPPGPCELECRLGSRYLGTFDVVIAPDQFWWRRRLHPAELYQSARRFLWARAEKRRRGSGYTCS
jgi:SAM-dependent methyltransferase